MPSRLVTPESRLLKKISFWRLSVKNLVSGLESTRPWSRVDSWTKYFLTQLCTNFCLRLRVGSSCLRVDSWRKYFSVKFCDIFVLRLRVGSSSSESRLLKKFGTNHSSVKNDSSGLESFLYPESRLPEIDSWTFKLWYTSDTPWNLSSSSKNLCPLCKGLLWLTFSS